MKGVYSKYASIMFGLEITVSRYAHPPEGRNFPDHISEEQGDEAEGHALAATELIQYCIGLWHILSLVDLSNEDVSMGSDSALVLALHSVARLGYHLSEAALMRVDDLHDAHQKESGSLILEEGGEE